MRMNRYQGELHPIVYPALSQLTLSKPNEVCDHCSSLYNCHPCPQLAVMDGNGAVMVLISSTTNHILCNMI